MSEPMSRLTKLSVKLPAFASATLLARYVEVSGLKLCAAMNDTFPDWLATTAPVSAYVRTVGWTVAVEVVLLTPATSEAATDCVSANAFVFTAVITFTSPVEAMFAVPAMYAATMGGSVGGVAPMRAVASPMAPAAKSAPDMFSPCATTLMSTFERTVTVAALTTVPPMNDFVVPSAMAFECVNPTAMPPAMERLKTSDFAFCCAFVTTFRLPVAVICVPDAMPLRTLGESVALAVVCVIAPTPAADPPHASPQAA